jgi:hypothetical protein
MADSPEHFPELNRLARGKVHGTLVGALQERDQSTGKILHVHEVSQLLAIAEFRSLSSKEP